LPIELFTLARRNYVALGCFVSPSMDFCS